MKNIAPQPTARQNNCRNTSSEAIASAGRSGQWPSRYATLKLIVVVLSCFAGRAIRNGKPRSLLRSGFSLSASSASNLPDSLRYAPAMMLRGLSLVPAPIQITALSDARRHSERNVEFNSWENSATQQWGVSEYWASMPPTFPL